MSYQLLCNKLPKPQWLTTQTFLSRFSGLEVCQLHLHLVPFQGLTRPCNEDIRPGSGPSRVQ